MQPRDLVFFAAAGLVVLMVIGFGALLVLSVVGKASAVSTAQQGWAGVVQRLGGHLLDRGGPLGTPRFKVGDALLLATNIVGTDRNIEHRVRPIDTSNDWKTYVVVPVKRPVPPFELLSGRHGGGALTGHPGFDAAWTIRPLEGARPDALFPLFDTQVLDALSALRGHYQLYSGGAHIHAVRPGAETDPNALAALLFVCRRFAGDA
ncbi:MAG: hypothetical protein RLO52_45940 [Sandaracinaceae bacterium]